MTRFLIPILLLTGNSYAAGIQKWTDENGNVNYGDTPPVKVQTESISVSRPPSNPGRPLPRLNTSEDKKKQTDAKTEQTRSPEISTEEANKERCEDARKNLDVIANNSLILMRKSDGTEQQLTDEEVDERRVKFEQDIQQYCK